MFYTVIQNNSGGYFIDNKDVAQVVTVEANTNYEAQRLLENITNDYGEYCECCGFRWDLRFEFWDIWYSRRKRATMFTWYTYKRISIR